MAGTGCVSESWQPLCLDRSGFQLRHLNISPTKPRHVASQAFLTRLLTVDLPGLMVLPKRLEISIPPGLTSVAEAAVGRDAVMRAVASAVLQVHELHCNSLGRCMTMLSANYLPHKHMQTTGLSKGGKEFCLTLFKRSSNTVSLWCRAMRWSTRLSLRYRWGRSRPLVVSPFPIPSR